MTRRGWRRLVATVMAAVAIIVLGLRLYLGRDAEDHLETDEAVDFSHLDLPRRTNAYLLCPSEPPVCSLPADGTSPIFPLEVVRLRNRWVEMVALEPRVRMVAADADRRHLVFIQRSAFFRFPDVITVEFIPLDAEHATLAVLSRARYGHLDFGVNAARIEAWIAKLQAMTGS